MFSHGFMSFAAIGVTVACLLIMGTFTLVAYNANENLADLQQENAIVAFVDETLEESEARALQTQIESTENVADCTFVSRTEARDAYVEKYDDGGVYGDLDATVFRHRFVIHVTDPNRIMETRTAVDNIPGIAKARDDEAVANGFTTVRNVAGVISVALIAILLLVSVFIISNTIKLTTFDRRDEIAIMKMVGATNGFIRWPFVYEGLLLGLFSGNQDAVVEISAVSCRDTVEIGRMYLREIPTYLWEMAVSMSPIVVIFLVFQWLSLRLSGKNLLKICFGILSTYIGLVLFLTGVNVGFSSLGAVLGASLAQGWTRYLMIPLAMLLGWFIISAEPAVYVLEKQIEDVSAGAIPGKAIKYSLSVAIALAMGLSMLRVLTGISIMWFLIPGYTLAILLSFRVPDIYTAIAFDSGGVASGPMTATFMLQFFIGASTTLGGNALRDAFGVVAMVAMMPLISIQVMGVIYGRKNAKIEEPAVYGDYEIIELWEGNE